MKMIRPMIDECERVLALWKLDAIIWILRNFDQFLEAADIAIACSSRRAITLVNGSHDEGAGWVRGREAHTEDGVRLELHLEAVAVA